MRDLLILCCSILMAASLLAQEKKQMEFSNLDFENINYGGFELTAEREIYINAVGAGFDKKKTRYQSRFYDPFNMFIYGWIIDANTRELKWRMTIGNTKETGDDKMLRKFSGYVDLPPGRYETYFYARKPYQNYIKDSGFPSIGNILRRFFRGEASDDDLLEECFLKIADVDEVFNAGDVRKYQQNIRAKAVVSIGDITNSDFREERFRLLKPGEFRVYALGEATEDGVFDYGWISREDDGKTVWEMRDENSTGAGGATKNRLWKTGLSLNSGDYVVHYVSDDTHSPNDWNANPPYDPAFWGIMLTGVSGKFNPASVKQYQPKNVAPILSLNHIGDDAYEKEGFELDRQSRIRVHALGEGRNGEMYDYGWIEDANSGRKIWEMAYNQTRHAGGAHKNRVEDAVLTIDPGKYWVYYISDDSHSYRHWNSRPPRHKEEWGITLFPADDTQNAHFVCSIKDPLDNPVVSLTKLGDNEYAQSTFAIEKPTRFRVFALGEGRDGEMFDYGWIEDARGGRRVWNMDYHKTRPAGGSKKNRLVDEMITLKPGTYTVFYRSDDSHSYNDWNTRPPRHKDRWGISLYLVDADKSTFKSMPRPPRKPHRSFEEMPDRGAILCRLIQIRDDEHARKAFELDRETRIDIYAIGEGSGGEMYDYGWIEDRDSREVVWIMDYDRTEWAGGGRKNRMTKASIILPAGRYLLHFVTDDSHAYRDWNTDPPRDRRNYGITVFRATEE